MNDFGILTTSNPRYFPCLVMLRESLGDSIPLACFDLSLQQWQKRWCEQNGIILTKSWIPPLRPHKWQTWYKPYYIMNSPFRRVLWIDPDAAVLRPLNSIEGLIAKRPQFTKPFIPEREPNLGIVDKVFPVKDKIPGVNAGVLGVDVVREREMLSTWKALVTMDVYGKERIFRSLDQSALVRAIELHKLEFGYLDRSWNDYPDKLLDIMTSEWLRGDKTAALFKSNSRVNLDNWLDEMRDKQPDSYIIHFFGRRKIRIEYLLHYLEQKAKASL